MTHRIYTACLPRLSYCSTGEVRIVPPINYLFTIIYVLCSLLGGCSLFAFTPRFVPAIKH